MPSRRLLFLLILMGLWTSPGRANLQIPGVGASQPSAAQQSAVLPDPLGRDNPRGCVLWVDLEKAKAAKAAMEKTRDPDVPGPEKLPPTA